MAAARPSMNVAQRRTRKRLIGQLAGVLANKRLPGDGARFNNQPLPLGQRPRRKRGSYI